MTNSFQAVAKKTISNPELEQQLTSYLHDMGLRVTPERMRIIQAMKALPQLFTVDQLYQRMNGDEQFPVSRATCFNNIKLLINAGLLLRHRVNDSDTLYQLRHDDTHCLLVCSNCGMVRPARIKNIAMAARHIGIRSFTPSHNVAYIYGLCKQCESKIKSIKQY